MCDTRLYQLFRLRADRKFVFLLLSNQLADRISLLLRCPPDVVPIPILDACRANVVETE